MNIDISEYTIDLFNFLDQKTQILILRLQILMEVQGLLSKKIEPIIIDQKNIATKECKEK